MDLHNYLKYMKKQGFVFLAKDGHEEFVPIPGKNYKNALQSSGGMQISVVTTASFTNWTDPCVKLGWATPASKAGDPKNQFVFFIGNRYLDISALRKLIAEYEQEAQDDRDAEEKNK